MVVEPIDYSASTGRALLQGLTAGRAIQGIRQTSQEMDAANAAADRQKLFYTALQNTPQDQLHKLRTEFPEYAENVQKEIGIQDAEHASFVNKALNNLSVAYASGNPQMVQQAIQAGAPALASMNVSTDDAWQTYQNDPQQFGTLLNATRYATMPIEKQVDAQQKQDKLNEDARSNRASEALTAQGQYISASNAAAGRDVQLRIHRDNMSMKMAELAQKAQAEGKVDPKLVRSINADISGFQKNYSAMKSASDNLQSLGKRNTPASQLGMIFNYMKSLDPQSVVREGEQMQVRRTDGIYGTLGNYVSQLQSGKMLNDSQVKDLIDTSKVMANTEGTRYNQQMDEYLSSYGDSLPSGLTKQFQSRKAKLYDDIPQQQQPAAQQTAQPKTSGYQSLWGD